VAYQVISIGNVQRGVECPEGLFVVRVLLVGIIDGNVVKGFRIYRLMVPLAWFAKKMDISCVVP
jgi:hypothetical protein